MPPRVRSLRIRLVLAMVLTAFASLVVMFLVFDHLEGSSSRRDALSEARTAADVMSYLAGNSADPNTLRRAAGEFGDEVIAIDMPGRPPLDIAPSTGASGGQRVEATRDANGGTVRVSSPVEPTRTIALELTGLAAAVLGIVIGTVLAGGAVFARGVTRPIRRMAAAADRVAGGDLSVRINSVPSAELDRLAVAFDGMTRRLEYADQIQREFISDLAHELATPLNAVTGLALALADGTVSAPKRAETAHLIRLESKRLAELLDALRHLHSLDLAEPTEFAYFDVAGLVTDCTRHLQPAADAAGVNLHVHTGADEAYGDPRLVSMAVENLVGNAIHYTPPGGLVDVRVSQDEPDSVVISVRDNGIGIRAEDQERIFDRLYRVDADRARSGGGFGIGLALVKRAASALNGRVELRSTFGEGSEFRFILPRTDAPAGNAPLLPDS
jgi:signal transduction histidine kinase